MWGYWKVVLTFPPVVAILIVGAIHLVLLPFMPESERSRTFNESLDYNRREGTHRVLYPDGRVSEPFSYGVAKDYAEMFGGKVIPK